VYRFLAALLFVTAYASCAAAQALPVPSHWKDQRGSDLLLYTIDGKGAFTGAFIDNSEAFACHYAPYDLQGQIHGHHVRFTVVWKNAAQDCKSQTTWSGRATGDTITTWWVLTHHDHKGAAKKMRGTDTFHKQF